ncbi:MAG: AraC family transcriptional regulator [Lachnospiraceae bacterium]|nr:AraC family transcriptional regulator [Lachnospiraceae bacterium]
MATDKNPMETPLYHIGQPFDAAYRNSATPFPVGPHSHNATEFYLTLTDLPDVLLGDTVRAVPAGTLIVIPPFCVHQLYHEAGASYERYILTVQDKWLSLSLGEGFADFSYLEESSAPCFLFPDLEQKRELIRHFDELLSFEGRLSPDSLVAFFTLLSDIHSLKKMQKKPHSLPVSASQQKVNDIIAYLNEHLRENLTISDLAAHFYLNPDYLGRLFKRHMHVPLGHYITLQRINAAEALLREGKTVSEVQELLGYSSYAYFFRTFEKVTGISPSKYRKL